MIRILHMSDTHGQMPVPLDEDYDCVVHSGDLLPNRFYGNRMLEELFQAEWLAKYAPMWSPRYWERPIFITPGNHDWIDATPILRELGMDARLLCNGALEADEITLWGHPWTPTFYDWNWMCGPNEMRGYLATAVEMMELGGIDVFVSHGPMYGVLDRTDEGDYAGCKVLRKVMQTVRYPPKALLHGHIHEAAGLRGFGNGMIVSNAARTQRVITL